MQSFISWLVHNKTPVFALFGFLIFWGIKSFDEVPIDAFPDITPKQVVIYTESPGNSAEDIEKMVTYPLESALAGMPGVRTIMSNTLFGLSYISIFFEEGYDIYFLRRLVSERIATVQIPQGWGKPELGPNTTGLGQVFWYRLEDTQGVRSLQELRSLQKFLVAPMLKSTPGVEEVTSWGGFDKVYQIKIDPQKLIVYRLAYNDVIEAIVSHNVSAGGQYLEFNGEQYLIRASSLYKSLEEIAQTPIKTVSGNTITLSDVASVQTADAIRFGAVSVNGKETVFAMVLQRSGTDAAKVVERLREKIERINAVLPKGVRIKTVYDRTALTKEAVATMRSALLSGVVLVAIVLFLFLFELRTALIVIISLPMSLLIAFGLMRYFHISANLMSLSGLAIAVGMIVDATIVVVENTYRRLGELQDQNPDTATVVIMSLQEVVKPVSVAVGVIIAVFVPLVWLGGLSGKLYAPMAINIVFVMIASLAVAFVLVPVLSALLLKPASTKESLLMRVLKALYLPLLRHVIAWRKSVVLLSVGLLVWGVYSLRDYPREFMPKLEEEAIMYRVISIPSTALSRSVQTAQEIERYILQNYDQITSVVSMIGRSEKGETALANYMEILVLPKEGVKNIKRLQRRITSDLQERFSHVRFVPTQPIAMRIEELLEGIQSELAIKLYGEDQKVLSELAKKIQEALRGVEGIKAVEPEVQLGQSSILISPKAEALGRYGIKSQEVMQIVRQAVGEEPVSELIEGVKRFSITAPLSGARNDIASLKNLTLRLSSGAVVTLQEIADISIQEGASFIKRENLNRYMVLSIEGEGDIVAMVKEANGAIAQKVSFPPGYFFEWAGDFKNLAEALQTLKVILPMIAGLIVLLLFWAFGSMKQTLLILLAVPLGLLGGIVALHLSHIPITVAVIIGFLAVGAIAILNGIVLVSFIEQMRKQNPARNIDRIIVQAVALRLRPVLMTALTTLLGVAPLLFLSGAGASVQYPLAVVIVGGIISSTLLTLVVLPAMYRMVYGR